jgi:hypothetical protein
MLSCFFQEFSSFLLRSIAGTRNRRRATWSLARSAVAQWSDAFRYAQY